MLILDVLIDRLLERKYRKQEIKLLNSLEKSPQNKRIKIVFFCHRPQLWNSNKSICDQCIADDSFDVYIITIPNKKQLPGKGLHHEEYVSEGAEEYFKDYSCTVINGYNYEKKEWFDLNSINPDYVFFQTPYDICRPYQYRSNVISLYSKMCYIGYGMPFMNGIIEEQSYPKKFLKNNYFQFAEFPEMKRSFDSRIPESSIRSKNRVIVTGYPKLDFAFENEGKEGPNWIYKGNEKKYRIMWAPRWNTEENNCTFFDLKDEMVEYAKQNNDVELLFRPHPQAFSEYIARGEMTKDEVNEYLNRFEVLPNTSIDTEKEYLPSFFSTDVFIADETSIIPEYFLTGKPIIFTYKETHLNEFATKISKGFYWAKNFEEVKSWLSKLRNGEDSLFEIRQELIKSAYYIPEKGAGYEIKEIIKNDYYSCLNN